MTISSFELCFAVGLITWIFYAIKKGTGDRFAAKLHQQIKQEDSIRAKLEDKERVIIDLETHSKALDGKQENLQKEINSKKANLENDEMLLQSLIIEQNKLSQHLQQEREATIIKKEGYKQEMDKFFKYMELKRAQFINKMNLFKKEIDAYKEQEVLLKTIITTLSEEETASTMSEELEQIQTEKPEHIEENKLLLANLIIFEDKIQVSNELKKSIETLEEQENGLQREIEERKAQIENNEKLLQSLLNRQTQLSQSIQHERQVAMAKEKERRNEEMITAQTNIKEHKKNNGTTIDSQSNGADILLIIICLFISPLAVILKVGCTKHFIINVILWILVLIPGIIHGLWIITTNKGRVNT